MKTLTVIDNNEITENLVNHLSPLGFEFMHYTNPLKAMDNLEEIRPDVVFFSAADFIRHWKPFLIVLREICSRKQTLFFILKGSTFDFEEASKASHLQVSGILHESLTDPEELDILFSVLSKNNLFFDHRLTRRYLPRAFDNLDFIFNHPRSMKIISGTLVDLSPGGLSFNPDNPQLTQDLASEEIIDYCSLSIGEEILSISVGVVRNNETLAMRFENLPDADKNKVTDYIQKSIDRALKVHSNAIH
ncbi:MAG: PilZ domain-containing protein [Spirochaetales bacterium]|nr:PilZ domain-containing protein [Spirochaetales bacterium]